MSNVIIRQVIVYDVARAVGFGLGIMLILVVLAAASI